MPNKQKLQILKCP